MPLHPVLHPTLEIHGIGLAHCGDAIALHQFSPPPRLHYSIYPHLACLDQHFGLAPSLYGIDPFQELIQFDLFFHVLVLASALRQADLSRKVPRSARHFPALN